jgi:hypothetical protein
MRQIDVGVLFTRPFLSVRSNVDLPDDKDPGFPWTSSRDCLEVTVNIGTEQRPQPADDPVWVQALLERVEGPVCLGSLPGDDPDPAVDPRCARVRARR